MSELSSQAKHCATVLSQKYGFKLDEALLLLGETIKSTSDVKKEPAPREDAVSKKKTSSGAPRGPRKKRGTVPLPWTGVVREGDCWALTYNNGLFTQCERKACSGIKYCDGCEKNRQENNGMCRYGTVEDRMKKDFSGADGKKLVQYGNVLEKKGISREKAENYAKEVGVKIPEEMFEVIKKKRGRPAKVSVEVSDTSSEGVRGCPPKKKGGGVSGEDLIGNLVACASGETPERPLRGEELGELGGEELGELGEKSWENPEEGGSGVSPDTDTVTEFIHEGEKYLRSISTEMLYDPTTEEPVGQWDESTGSIIKLDLDSGDEEN